jgi:hypothetical protein
MLPAASIGVGNLGRRAHCTDFPENDAWREACCGPAGQTTPHIGTAYFR